MVGRQTLVNVECSECGMKNNVKMFFKKYLEHLQQGGNFIKYNIIDQAAIEICSLAPKKVKINTQKTIKFAENSAIANSLIKWQLDSSV